MTLVYWSGFQDQASAWVKSCSAPPWQPWLCPHNNGTDTEVWFCFLFGSHDQAHNSWKSRYLFLAISSALVNRVLHFMWVIHVFRTWTVFNSIFSLLTATSSLAPSVPPTPGITAIATSKWCRFTLVYTLNSLPKLGSDEVLARLPVSTAGIISWN